MVLEKKHNPGGCLCCQQGPTAPCATGTGVGVIVGITGLVDGDDDPLVGSCPTRNHTSANGNYEFVVRDEWEGGPGQDIHDYDETYYSHPGCASNCSADETHRVRIQCSFACIADELHASVWFFSSSTNRTFRESDGDWSGNLSDFGSGFGRWANWYSFQGFGLPCKGEDLQDPGITITWIHEAP